ncbi:NUDIX hydrolase N-terminal domain-containing protein [Nocardiopsis sp. HNM0947]|uniref:NUDIX hydrolase N-terminal domain-containing protein n=1 Tax=Nocardiopsis coralli TaxID=2772213 RepID=A0ABR9P8K3_9ACTN|nr:NUDIX hydrolase N-terminal domain-containing protein [Nocardiopsis coralli]MBE3000165.1 NUDIX hydrolase N-terminal domain-containing protein [Nocardiopsis coralli]
MSNPSDPDALDASGGSATSAPQDTPDAPDGSDAQDTPDAPSDTEHLRRISIELTALSQSALAYCTDRFDIERFHRIGALARDLMQTVAREDLPAYEPEVAASLGYATPKLDVRGGVFDPQGRVLLVRERADGDRWTLPGGWCDVLERPREAIEREVLEEAGMQVRAVHLAGVLDRHEWPHTPVYDRHVYKLMFVCEPAQSVETDFDAGFTSDETSEVGWFDVHDLPELSVARVLPEQIRLLHGHWKDPGPAHVD